MRRWILLGSAAACIATSSLAEPEGFCSTPVVDGDRLYIRGDDYLYCIGRK